MKYILTSKIFEGKIIYGFDAAGSLEYFELDAHITDVQHGFIIKNMPVNIGALMLFVQKSNAARKVFSIDEMQEDISFERFWNDYGYKVGNKPKAEQLFKKLSDADKLRCIKSIKSYEQWRISKNIEKIYAERYISQRRFDNEYKI